MKYLSPIIFLFLISCGTSTEEEIAVDSDSAQTEVLKFLPKDLEISSNGLDCDDTYLYAGGMRSTSVYFQFGQKVFLNFTNISGFKKVDGMIFPIMDSFIISEEGDTISSGYDLDLGIDGGFKSKTGGIDLNSNIYLDTPMEPHKNYRWDNYVRDRNSDKTLSATCIIGVTRNEKLTVTNSNASCLGAYLFDLDEGMVITSNRVFPGQRIKVYFDGLDGFEEIEERIFIGMEVKMTNENGDIILYAENGLSDYAEDGIKAEVVKTSIYGVVEIPNDEAGPLNLTIRVFDLNSKAEVTAEISLEVVQLG